MEPKCHNCHERAVCRESLSGLCWECVRSCLASDFGDKGKVKRRAEIGYSGERPIDYPPSEATS